MLCLSFRCIHKWTKSICFHQVLSEKTNEYSHKSIRIRKHQRGAEIRSLFPPQLCVPGYYDWSFSTEIWLWILHTDCKDSFQNDLPTGSVLSMNSPLQQHTSVCAVLPIPTSVLWFPTTHPTSIFSHYTFFGMSFSTFVNNIHLQWLNSNTPLPSIGSSLRSDHPSTWKSLMASQCSEGRVFRFC